MALDIKTAGIEFVKSVLTLYRSTKYFGEKEILSKKFLDYSIEAGRLITEVSRCDGKQESLYAKQALDELGKAMFILKVMEEACIYSRRRIQPVEALSEQITELVSLYVSEEHSTESVSASVVETPQQIDNRPVTLISDHDDDGFNEVYTGKL